jgi:hypothetical protein
VELEPIDRPGEVSWGVCQPSAVAIPAANANALFDATGVRLRSIPLPPQKVKTAWVVKYRRSANGSDQAPCFRPRYTQPFHASNRRSHVIVLCEKCREAGCGDGEFLFTQSWGFARPDPVTQRCTLCDRYHRLAPLATEELESARF